MKQKCKTKWKANPAEDRISELKGEMVIKGKTELFVKQLKTCEKKMQELTDSIKRPNLRIMGIEEGEQVQAKGMHNIFNNIITENFPNLEKTMPIEVQEDSRTPNRSDQNRTTPRHIIIKTTSTETRERKWRANNIQRKAHQNHSSLLNGNIKSKKSLGLGLLGTE
jgi:hypothetical protein